MARIAITGGICEGKSTVLQYAREAGWSTLSADDVAKEVWADPDVQRIVAAALDLEEPLEREAVRKKIALNAEDRRTLNALMHPLILKRMLASSAEIHEVPLLIEACLHPLYSEVWVVTCGREEQLARLTARLGDRAKAEALIESQLSSRTKMAFAHRVIRTNQTPANVQAEVHRALPERKSGVL